MEKTKLHRSYRAMKSRCYDPKYHSFKHYGGRGITVCEEWLNPEKVTIGRYIHNQSKGYIAFKEWALHNGYREGLTLDRIDTDKGYSPENCRWVTMKVQSNNKRNNKLITYKGVTMTLKQWSEKLNINYHTVHSRLNRSHWTIEEAFEKGGNISCL